MKNTCKKTITFSIILLLIGVSVSSAISVDTKSPVVNQQSEEDCGCNKLSDTEMIYLEKQLNKVEVYTRLLMVLSKDNPEDYPILCDFIIIIAYSLIIPIGIIDIIRSRIRDVFPLLEDILMMIIDILDKLIAPTYSYLMDLGESLKCEWRFPHLKLLYRNHIPTLEFSLNPI